MFSKQKVMETEWLYSSPEIITYKIQRCREFIRKPRFVFYDQDETPKYNALFSRSKHCFIISDIKNGNEIGLLVTSNHDMEWVLRTGDQKRLHLEISSNQIKNIICRSCAITVYGNDEKPAEQVREVVPSVNANGEIYLNYGKRKAVPSVKNIILARTVDGSEVVGIRKVQRDRLCLDVHHGTNELYLFVIGIADFASPTFLHDY